MLSRLSGDFLALQNWWLLGGSRIGMATFVVEALSLEAEAVILASLRARRRYHSLVGCSKGVNACILSFISDSGARFMLVAAPLSSGCG